MIVQKIRNFDLVASSAKHTAYEQPTNVDVLPPELESVKAVNPCEDDELSDTSSVDGKGGRLPSEPGSGEPGDFDGVGDTAGENKTLRKSKEGFPSLVSLRCGDLPRDTQFPQFLCLSVRPASTSAEDQYAARYANMHTSVFPPDATSMPPFAQMDELKVFLEPSEAIVAAEQQRQFFKDLDAYKVDNATHAPNPASLGSASRTSWETRLTASVEELGVLLLSRTVVMEAAFRLIKKRAFTHPGCWQHQR